MLHGLSMKQTWLLVTVVAFCAAACDEAADETSEPSMNTDATITTDASLSSDVSMSPDQMTLNCDPVQVLADNGCGASGCHATPVQASLDLVSDGFEHRLLNAVSPTEGCEGRLIIDVERPEESLMLQVIGAVPPLGGEIDTCQTVMPPSGDISDEDRSCLTQWVYGLAEEAQTTLPGPAPFEATPIYSGLRKVKALVNGGVPTVDEVTRIEAEPSSLRALVSEWSDGAGFDNKLSDFLLVSLQQRIQTIDNAQFDRLRTSRQLGNSFARVVEQSFVRTAAEIVKTGRPFTDVNTTRSWMVTTANLVLLRFPDQSGSDKGLVHTLTDDETLAPSALTEQIRDKTWLLPDLGANCQVPQSEVLDMLFGFVSRRRCRLDDGSRPMRNIQVGSTPLVQSDFQDWRMVEFVPHSEESGLPLIDFFDVESLRAQTRMSTRLPRVGFFTTNVFFNNWATNVDNLYRVTTNQALLVALNIGFSSSEGTEPVSDEGLDAEHAASAPACYGCHKQLDPMRLYLARDFDVSYQLRTEEPNELAPFSRDLTPSFAFRGYQDGGGDTYRFAEILSEHPRFAHAWVQKLCLFANSERCSERDPLFLELVERFKSSNYDFKALWVDVFSSPLVTGFTETDTYRRQDQIISITRLNHLCPLLQERTGRENVCDVTRVAQVRGLIPKDDFARGAVDPTQPALSSAFHFAAAEAVCEEVARTVVNRNSEFFSFSDDGFVNNLVTRLMGLTIEHDRYALTLATLEAHREALLAEGMSNAEAARATFAVACLTPDVMGVGL